MPQTLVSTDSTVNSVDAVVAMLGRISRGRGLDARLLAGPNVQGVRSRSRAPTNQTISRVEDAVIARDVRSEVVRS